MNKVSIYPKNDIYFKNLPETRSLSFGARYSSDFLHSDTFENRDKRPERFSIGRIISNIGAFFRGQSVQHIEVQKPVFEVVDNNIKNNTNNEELLSSEMALFLDSPEYEEKIKQATMGKYQEKLIGILSKEGMTEKVKKDLIESGLTEEEFLTAIKKISKSTFKAALNNPSQYINYTQDSMFSRFLYDAMEKGVIYTDTKSSAGDYMQYFFGNNIVKIVKALQYVDTDALNQMMDKRSTGFSIMLDSLNKITPENGKLLKELISHTKEGDASQKIKLCQLVSIFQSNNFDMNLLRNLGEDNNINADSLNQMFQNALIQKFDIDTVDENINTKFNENYIHLLFSEYAMLNCGNPFQDSNFETLIREAVKGKFQEFILDETNQYGAANSKTKKEFECRGLDYNQWLHPQIQKRTFEADNKKMSVYMWERNPFEDLFIGNKTRCCTAVTTGSNSAAMPLFLLNTAFNYIEVADEKGDVKGMARVYMADIDQKPSLVIDSIELTDIKEMEDKEKLLFAKNIYEYAQQFAQTVTNTSTPVYYIEQDSKIPIKIVNNTEIKKTNFIGDLSCNRIYTNANSSGRWGDIREESYIGFFKSI